MFFTKNAMDDVGLFNIENYVYMYIQCIQNMV